MEFQVAVSDSPDGPFEFVGPNGHWSTRFTTAAGEALPTLVGRYLRYRCYLHSFDGVSSPAVSNVQISFSGLQPSSVTTYSYDAAGNRTRKVVETDDGVILEEVLDDEGWAPEDRINTLNQVVRRDVITGAGTTSWDYTWDPDGNLTSKTDGTNTFDYTWSDEGRLTRVEGPGGLDIEFEYDSLGRMLRRVDGADSWAMEWDGWDLVRETAPDGTVIRYFCPQGELHRFQRGDDYYSVHSDALGSVRTITDATGRTVAEFQYGAYGETLSSSVDEVPGGFPYRFVGALGCRVDDEVGLIYMRNRWYSPVVGRFVSRDPIHHYKLVGRDLIPTLRRAVGAESNGETTVSNPNLYDYGWCNPVKRVDPFGLATAVDTRPPMPPPPTEGGGGGGGGCGWWNPLCIEKAAICVMNCYAAVATAALLEPELMPLLELMRRGCLRQCYFCGVLCNFGLDRFNPKCNKFPFWPMTMSNN